VIGEVLRHSGQSVMLLKTCRFHNHHLSLSWSFDIIRHTQTMIRSCALMSYLHLTRQALVCFRWPNSPPFSGRQHPKTKPPYGLYPLCPTKLLFFCKIIVSLSAVNFGMLAVHVATRIEIFECAHLPTPMFSQQGSHCHYSSGSPLANVTFSLPSEPH
jgi:hypothetical protein